MITIYIDTTQGLVIETDQEDDLDDGFTKGMVADVADAALAAFNKAMGVGEVLH